MIIVQSTREVIPEIEVNVDTVYVRSNIRRIEEDDFIGWEYEETQYDKNNYIELLSEENKQLKEADLINKMALTEIFEMFLIYEGGSK